MRFFLILAFLYVSLFAIVAIKPREVGEHPGTTGEVAGSLETRRGNTDKDNYSLSFKMEYDSNTTWLVWGMVRGEYGEASGEKNTNNFFSHLRYIRNVIGDHTAVEIFLQAQEDEFKDIKDRSLAGGGIRWKASREDSKWGGAFLGLGLFYEYVGYSTTVDPLERNARMNSYLAYTFRFEETGLFAVAAYYQPRVDRFDDYMSIVAARVEVSVYKQLYVGIRVAYEYDSHPAVGVKNEDFTQTTLFKYKF